MSLNPPLKPFASGVRMARVITTSSAFLDVLLRKQLEVFVLVFGGEAYIDDNPEEPGVRCLRIELSLSPAILKVFGYVGSYE